MEKLPKIFLMLGMVCLLFSCRKSDPFGDDLKGDDLKSAGKKCGEVIVVNPTGGDDTDELTAAFEEAKASGPGATVQLVEGTYTIGMIEVREFRGCFTGAGKGKTIIQNLPELPCEPAWEVNTCPALLKFYGGNILISNLTIRFQDGKACAPGELNDAIYGDIACGILLADFSGTYFPDKRYIKGMVDDVEVIAGDDGGFGVYGTKGNVAMGIYFGSDAWWLWDNFPLTNGDITITNSYFKDNLVGPDVWGTDENSTVIIRNNIIEGGLAALYLGGIMGSRVTMSNNQYSVNDGGWFGLWVDSYDFYSFLPSKETKYSITGNKIDVPEGTAGIFIRDHYRTNDPDAFPQLFDVRGNVIKGKAGSIGILSVNNRNAKIWNNTFTGSGSIGVCIDGEEPTETWTESVEMAGNNFLGGNYSDAGVYLGPYSKDCKIVGVNSDMVVDDGTGNSVIGTKAHKKGIPSMQSPAGKINPFMKKIR